MAGAVTSLTVFAWLVPRRPVAVSLTGRVEVAFASAPATGRALVAVPSGSAEADAVPAAAAAKAAPTAATPRVLTADCFI
ncbi:hypothetical protein EES39_16710 [Streptomyces sp. ADI92-24]|nr:hypothetical protein EES39_16710 [Streptomyces sp. ADI92-24]